MMSSLFVSMIQLLASAQAQTAAAPGGSAPQAPVWMQFAPFLVILVVFYFFILRPQAKKQKEHAQFLESLKPGDQVITQSGFLGKIASVQDKYFEVDLAHQVRVKILKNFVSAQPKTEETK